MTSNLSNGESTPAPAPAIDEKEFDRLLAQIVEDPNAVNGFDEETVLAVYKKINPYGGIAGPPAEKDWVRAIACSYTNLREDYLRRLTATSLIGFLGQLAHEWEVPAEARRWAPAPKPAAATAPYNPAALVQRLEAVLAVAQEAAAAAAAADAAEQDARVSDLSDESRQRLEELTRDAVMARERATGLLWAATQATHGTAVEASDRLRETAALAMKSPGLREVLAKYPPPAEAGSLEMPKETAKGIITGFLRNAFEFDPSVHVRSGLDKKTVAAAVAKEVGREADGTPAVRDVDSADPASLTLSAVRRPPPLPADAAAARTVLALRERPNWVSAATAVSRDEEAREAVRYVLDHPEVDWLTYLGPVAPGSPARPAAETVPPQDTFHRWNYYTEVNYDALRTITEAIYPERPDLDWALAPWAYFEGTRAEVDAAFEKHCQRYSEEVPSSLKLIEFGSWSLLADFAENRQKIEFYNKHTEVLKRILDRHAADKPLGAELMRNRVKQVKAKNIAEEGPDAPGLRQYRSAVAEGGKDLGRVGAERVITAEEMRRLELSRGNVKAAQELEHLEQLEKTIETLTALAKRSPLTPEEERDLKRAQDDLPRAREMAAVPEGAIQVDAFVYDPRKDEFKRQVHYTKADETLAAEAAAAVPAFAPFAVEHMEKNDLIKPVTKSE